MYGRNERAKKKNTEFQANRARKKPERKRNELYSTCANNVSVHLAKMHLKYKQRAQ